MSDRKHRRLMVITAIVGLLMALYSSRCSPAHADAMILPSGTVITIPGKAAITLDATHFAVTRSQLDRANAAASTSRRLTAQLTACTRAVVRATQPEAGWRIAGRWALIGIAVSGAFFGGLSL